MARVYNWQLGREMSYWYPESRPKRQFAAVFDTNKCIACQTCTMACKTTWTSGGGRSTCSGTTSRPSPTASTRWLRRQAARHARRPVLGRRRVRGQTIFESAPAGERVLGWRPEEQDYAYPNVGEDDCAGQVEKGAAFVEPHMNWFFYLARICNHCTYPACLASCPRGSIYKRPEDGIVLVDQGRCRGYQECVKGCPYKKVFFNPMTGTSEKCIACFPKIEQGSSRSASSTASARSAWRGSSREARSGAPGQPHRLPGARAQDRAAPVPAVRPGAERLLHPADPRAARVKVRALHDGAWVAFRLEWRDASKDELFGPSQFSDAAAVQVPRDPNTDPSPMMGQPGSPVRILYWKAAWQTADMLAALHPNKPPTDYPFEGDRPCASRADWS
jgi:Fe-S-cluster-containing dehydrogenase component